MLLLGNGEEDGADPAPELQPAAQSALWAQLQAAEERRAVTEANAHAAVSRRGKAMEDAGISSVLEAQTKLTAARLGGAAPRAMSRRQQRQLDLNRRLGFVDDDDALRGSGLAPPLPMGEPSSGATERRALRALAAEGRRAAYHSSQ